MINWIFFVLIQLLVYLKEKCLKRWAYLMRASLQIMNFLIWHGEPARKDGKQSMFQLLLFIIEEGGRLKKVKNLNAK